VRLEVSDATGTLVYDGHFPTSVLTWWDGLPEAVQLPGSQVIMRGRYRARADGPHLVGAAGVGLLRVAVDGSRLAESRTLPPREVVEAFSRPPELRVPVATFTGWNPRHPDQGAPGDLMSMMGSTLPFARTAAERTTSGDPRPSLEERYGARDRYLARVRSDAQAMVADRHLLAEDLEAVVERAGALWDFVCPR